MSDTAVVDRGDEVAVAEDTTPETPETPAAKVDDTPVDNAEGKGAADEADDEDKGAKRDGKWIPKDRFDQAVRKEREKAELANKQLQELKEKETLQSKADDIVQAQAWMKEMVRKRNSLLADGELEKASEIDDKILEVQDAIADRRAEMRSEKTKETTKAEMQYDAAVAKVEAMYPQIDPDSEDYDAEAVSEVRALMRGYQQELKLSASKALERAAKRIFGEVDKKSADSQVEAGLRRKQEAVERNLEVAKKQPPPTKDVGLDHDKKGGGLDAKTVMKLDYKEFNKLSDEVLSSLRGDTL
jgi:hypothetical protein